MKKDYESPQFDFHQVFLLEDVLTISIGEGTGSGGTVVDPPDNPNDPWGGDGW